MPSAKFSVKMAQPVHFKATVSEIIIHSPEVHSYSLVSERRLPRFMPGQFIHLSLEAYDPSTFWPESRVFSVANSVPDSLTLKLVIGKQGRYTRRIIDELRVGSIVSCKGPYGDFIIRRDDQAAGSIVLIAGGTGITPFSSFMESILQQDSAGFSTCYLFYGARNADLLISRQLADACASKFSNFKVFYYAEEEVPGKIRPTDISPGRLGIKAITEAVKPEQAPTFYLSGPKMMIDYFSHELTSVCNYPPESVIIDAW
jgi:ferredoxin-NADP reductase